MLVDYGGMQKWGRGFAILYSTFRGGFPNRNTQDQRPKVSRDI